MRSIDDNFWKTVEGYCHSKRKPLIHLELVGLNSSEVLEGTIENFVPRVSISIRSGDDLRTLDLRGCTVKTAGFPRPLASSNLESWNEASSFSLRRGDTGFAFTFLRDFGESN